MIVGSRMRYASICLALAIAAIACSIARQATAEPTLQDAASAAKLFEAGRFAEAGEIYTRLVAQDPIDQSTVLQLGRIALLANRLDDAEKWLGRALTLKPDNTDAKIMLAEAFYRGDDFQKAASTLDGVDVATNKLVTAQYPTLNVAALQSFKGQTPYELQGDGQVTRLKFVNTTGPLPVVDSRSITPRADPRPDQAGPDPAAGAERLGPRLPARPCRLADRGQRQRRVRPGGRATARRGPRRRGGVLAMAPANATETIRKALAMGAQRGVLVTDPALAGADLPTTIRVIAAAAAGAVRPPAHRPRHLGREGGAVAAGVAARLGLPLLSAAADRAGSGGRRGAGQAADRQGLRPVEAPMPAVVACTQALGAPRYPSLKGIMAARSREIAVPPSPISARHPMGPPAAAGRPGWSRRTRRRRAPRARGEGAGADAAREIADFLAARRMI